jgi:hypothetical protein
MIVNAHVMFMSREWENAHDQGFRFHWRFVNDESLSFAIRIFVYDSSALFLLTIVLEKANLVSSKV